METERKVKETIDEIFTILSNEDLTEHEAVLSLGIGLSMIINASAAPAEYHEIACSVLAHGKEQRERTSSH